ncbi:MAG: hypothetical protein GYB31_17530 [Bacteroidetes bacterium]|nr:hypothetical protein [Bacteroidota bacterium]
MKTSKPILLLVFLISFLSCEVFDGNPKDAGKYLTELGSFHDLIHESSGLAMDGDSFWTHNDSGSDPMLYRINKEAKIVDMKYVDTPHFVDWESVDIGDGNLYIGDLGNNNGDRMDLGILQISLAALQTDVDTVSSFFYSMTYDDQEDFSTRPLAHNYDCEAIIQIDDETLVITKNHLDMRTNIYTTEYAIGLDGILGITDIGGLVTGAAVHPDEEDVFLLAYRETDGMFSPFIVHFYDFEDFRFWRGESQQVDVPLDTQVEGLAVDSDYQLYISSESNGSVPGKLYQLDFNPWLK